MKTIYSYWKSENIEKHYLRKSYRIARKLGIGRTRPYEYGTFINDAEWVKIKEYLFKDRRYKR